MGDVSVQAKVGEGMTNQVPISVGRVVHVPMDAESNNGIPYAAGIVTRVWGDDTINVTVWPDTETSGLIRRTSATYVDQLPERFTDRQTSTQNNVWTWPPRV